MTWVTVVIPCYNAGADLKKAILSVLQQSHPKIELIIQDAESSDPTTISILQEFKDQCRIVVEKDNGIFDAFQKGIEKGKGDWIYLMGADDQLASEHVIQRLVQYDFGNQYDLILGTVENTHSISQWIPKTFVSHLNWEMYWRNTIHQQGCIYRKSIFTRHPFRAQFKILGDYHLHLLLYLAKCKALTTSLTFAVCKADGLSKKFTWPLYQEEIKIKLRLLPFPLNILTAFAAMAKFGLKKIIPRAIQQ
jgi:glycosyltransferase involved in cell wall biosynthesis